MAENGGQVGMLCKLKNRKPVIYDLAKEARPIKENIGTLDRINSKPSS